MNALLDRTTKRESKLAVFARVKAMGRQLAQTRRRYIGGLAAETQSLEAFRRQTAVEIRRELLSRRGRKIDLVGLLTERRADGRPVWCLADPTKPLGDYNGAWTWPDTTGAASAKVAGVGLDVSLSIKAGKGGSGPGTLLAAGIVPLPATVRKLATSKRIRRHAKMVGVLFQPDEWRLVNPDPALVVEWVDLPGQYFALAVWGGDAGRIMEFVE